ncbi:MAG: SH3 domain-containing protein [Anaerolineae bacterium]
MKYNILRLTLLLALLVFAAPLAAQEEPTLEAPGYLVYVTTQDNVSLREGPGTAFKRLAVVPSVTTLPAIGRTTDASWIQVVYGEQRGWIDARWLVWSGPMMTLPADGVNPVPFIRLIRRQITVTDSMAIYNQVNYLPGQRVTFPAPSATVELTGRLGSGSEYWLQFFYNGQYYWLGMWNLRYNVPGSRFNEVPDAGYVYPFGRVYEQIVDYNGRARQTYNDILRVWVDLATGSSASCNFIPDAAVSPEVSQSDLESEAILIPSMRALQAAIDSTNAAIDLFQSACGQEGENRFLTTETVNEALDYLATARRNFDLLSDVLPPTANRDPAFGGS